MKKCANNECIVGYEHNPEGSSFLGIEDYLELDGRGAHGDLWGFEAFKYCPECGCKVEDVLLEYLENKSKIGV